MKAKLSNFVALDVGSSKIAGIAAYIDKKGEIKILSQNLHYSEGIKSGSITDLKAAENSIVGAIYGLEKECDKNIKQVAISLSGVDTKSYYINQKIKLSGTQVISKQDIKRLIQKALSGFKIKDQEIIHYFPIEFVIDAHNIVDDPLGMYGKELSCQLHIISAASALLINLTNCFAKCQIEITEIVLSIHASGLSCLSEDEKNIGTFIIDIGSRTTAFGIFLSGKLIYTGCVPIGSAHITSDIAKVFSVSIIAAEKLKVLYGSVNSSSFDRDAVISMDDIDPENPYSGNIAITSITLAEVIEPRVEEIFMLIKEQYDKIVIDHIMARRLVITGGGSALRGIKELASKIFEKQVRLGKPVIVPGFAEGYNPGMYSTAIGMVQNHAIKQHKSSFELSAIEANEHWLKKTIAWIKENI